MLPARPNRERVDAAWRCLVRTATQQLQKAVRPALEVCQHRVPHILCLCRVEIRDVLSGPAFWDSQGGVDADVGVRVSVSDDRFGVSEGKGQTAAHELRDCGVACRPRCRFRVRRR